jgi:hypothetical protein
MLPSCLLRRIDDLDGSRQATDAPASLPSGLETSRILSFRRPNFPKEPTFREEPTALVSAGGARHRAEMVMVVARADPPGVAFL